MATYTYTEDPINIPLDEVRMLLTDTGTSDNNNVGAPANSKFGCIVSDEVINYQLAKIPDNVYRVCQVILKLVITGLQGGNQRYKTLLSQRTGDLQESYGDSAQDAMYVVEQLIKSLKDQELSMLGTVSDGMEDECPQGLNSLKLLDITSNRSTGYTDLELEKLSL